MMIQTICNIIVIFLIAGTTGVYAAESVIVGDFSRDSRPGKLPSQWEVLAFDGITSKTKYRLHFDKERTSVHAISRGGASGLIRKIEIDPALYPLLSFSWKIDGIITGANLRKKSGDDAPARVYVTFAYDAGKVGFWEMVKFEAIKLIYGEYPPIASLVYVWASSIEQGAVFDNPYTDRAKVFVLESGEENKMQWLQEQRNIVRDYKQAFAEDGVPMISGIAIMTDTDNTGGSATAWYGDILFTTQAAAK